MIDFHLQISQLGAGNNLGFNIAFNVGFGLAFVTAMYVLFYIKERVSRAKLLQFVSGVNKVIFWMTSFVIDYLQFLLITLLLLGVLAAYQKDGFSTVPELGRNFILLVAFGFGALPFTYILSFLFQVPSTGLVRLSIAYIVSGVFAFMAYFILSNEIFNLQYISDPLGWVFLIFPHYSLAIGMSNLNIKQSTLSVCDQQCAFNPLCVAAGGVKAICEAAADINCDNIIDPVQRGICGLLNSCCDRNFYSFRDDGIGKNLVALLIIGVVSFLLLFAVEYRWIQNLFYQCKKEKR